MYEMLAMKVIVSFNSYFVYTCTYTKMTLNILHVHFLNAWLVNCEWLAIIANLNARNACRHYFLSKLSGFKPELMLLNPTETSINATGSTWINTSINATGSTWISTSINANGSTLINTSINAAESTCINTSINANGSTWINICTSIDF